MKFNLTEWSNWEIPNKEDISPNVVVDGKEYSIGLMKLALDRKAFKIDREVYLITDIDDDGHLVFEKHDPYYHRFNYASIVSIATAYEV